MSELADLQDYEIKDPNGIFRVVQVSADGLPMVHHITCPSGSITDSYPLRREAVALLYILETHARKHTGIARVHFCAICMTRKRKS